MTDKALDPQELYESEYREGWGEGKSWEDLGNLGRSVMGEVAKQEAIRRRLESLTSVEFDREAEASHAEMLRLSGVFEQLQSDTRKLGEDFAAAKQKHETDSERLNERVRALNGEWGVADRKEKVIQQMKEQRA